MIGEGIGDWVANERRSRRWSQADVAWRASLDAEPDPYMRASYHAAYIGKLERAKSLNDFRVQFVCDVVHAFDARLVVTVSGPSDAPLSVDLSQVLEQKFESLEAVAWALGLRLMVGTEALPFQVDAKERAKQRVYRAIERGR